MSTIKPTASGSGYHVIVDGMRVGLVLRIVSRITNRVEGWQMYTRINGEYVRAGETRTRAAAVRWILR